MKKLIQLNKLLLTLSLSSVFSIAFAQQKPHPSPPESFFPKEKAKVLLVGSFHFHYPGLDAHVTSKTDKIDVLSANKKKELDELVAYIKRFKPTKVAIEAYPEWQATEKLRAYQRGGHRSDRDERYQLGIRIASEMSLDTVYSIDDSGMASSLSKLDTSYFRALFKDYDYKSDDPFSKMFSAWYNAEDKLKSQIDLLSYFKHINSRAYHTAGHGAYLVGDFKLDNKRGADVLAIHWYSRNLRIFRKLQEITSGPQDRILVVFGNGHGSILRQLLESSPEYDFIEFDTLQ